MTKQWQGLCSATTGVKAVWAVLGIVGRLICGQVMAVELTVSPAGLRLRLDMAREAAFTAFRCAVFSFASMSACVLSVDGCVFCPALVFEAFRQSLLCLKPQYLFSVF